MSTSPTSSSEVRVSISAEEIARIVGGWLKAMEARRDEVNALNVFPVPDGDTGTNMFLTLQSVLNEVTSSADKSISGIAKAIKDGSLKGARGNSGVIMSQILRGLSDTVIESGAIDAKTLARALTNGTNVAYDAVMKPVEGTMLTVIKDIARAARRQSRKSEDIDELLRAAMDEGRASLARTPELLDTLKEAGVVDAGGMGLIIMLEASIAVLNGDLEWLEAPADYAKTSAVPEIAMPDFTDKEIDLEYIYCTEFFIKGKDLDPIEFRDSIENLGGSLMVVGDSGVLKTHIHTNDPGLLLAAATARGELSGLKIDNMREQTAETTGRPTTTAKPVEHKAVGVVAIAVGNGIKDILLSLGVASIVDGGQTMNPSTEDIVKAVEAAPADAVIVLPNNKNIILTAKQAATLTDKQVYVVPTTSAPEAFSALIAYDESKSLNENGRAMDAAAALVKTGEVTTASRDSKVKKKKVIKGDIIGIGSGSFIAGGGTVAETSMKLIKAMADENTEVITLIKGEDFDETELPKLLEKIAKKFPEAETNVYEGGQPLYPLIIGVE